MAWVPGAFEIPLIASKMAKSGKYDAVLALGAVIRGSTSHYDYVCSEVSKGVAQVALNSDIPVMFGVLTTDTIEPVSYTHLSLDVAPKPYSPRTSSCRGGQGMPFAFLHSPCRIPLS